MPVQMWKYRCCGSSSNCATCSRCGAHGSYDGWHYTMHELMARYQYSTGLKPIGPHRKVADSMLNGHRIRCTRCDGRGLLHIDDERYAHCPHCEAMGYLWTLPPDDIDAIRFRILERFPSAEARRSPSRFDNAPMVLDLGNSRIISEDDVEGEAS